MRPIAFLAGAGLLCGACSDTPSDATMIAWLKKDARFPDCDAAAKPHFVSREPGGGWQGGGVTIELPVSGACRAQWTQALRGDQDCVLNIDRFQCSESTREGSVIKMSGDKATIYLWSLT